MTGDVRVFQDEGKEAELINVVVQMAMEQEVCEAPYQGSTDEQETYYEAVEEQFQPIEPAAAEEVEDEPTAKRVEGANKEEAVVTAYGANEASKGNQIVPQMDGGKDPDDNVIAGTPGTPAAIESVDNSKDFDPLASEEQSYYEQVQTRKVVVK